jgi:hypothetical protein
MCNPSVEMRTHRMRHPETFPDIHSHFTIRLIRRQATRPRARSERGTITSPAPRPPRHDIGPRGGDSVAIMLRAPGTGTEAGA